MDKLEHDPKTKQQIKDALYSFIYDPVQKQFKNRIDTLIIRNAVAAGYSHKHVMYKGVLYNSESTPPPLRKNRLVPALRPQMEEYLADVQQLNNHELPYVLGFLNQVLNASSDLSDYLKMLPESVHHPLAALMATCPCRTSFLPDERVQHIRAKNQESIDLIKRRLVFNLLI